MPDMQGPVPNHCVKAVSLMVYQDVLAGILEGIHPPCFVQHPLLPLCHEPYVLLEPHQPVPPAWHAIARTD